MGVEKITLTKRENNRYNSEELYIKDKKDIIMKKRYNYGTKDYIP